MRPMSSGRIMGKNNKKLTNSEVDSILSNIHDNKVVRIGDYINARSPIEFKCNTHNFIWKTSPCNIFNKSRGCPICGGSKPLSSEKIDEILENRAVSRIGDYINTKTKIEFQCKECNGHWFAIPGNVIRKTNPSGCPNCLYKREKFVLDILRDNFEYVKVHHYIKTNDIHFNRINVDFL